MENKKQIILSVLNSLFPNPKPSLTGWETPFQFLVAVVLSGNSTDKAVNAVTPHLFAVAPDAKTMSALSLEAIRSIIAPCGLGERKAGYLHALAMQLEGTYAGEPPASMELLVQLPGVGRKTASVFLGVIHNQPTFPVDTHILRLAHRWKISSKRSPQAAEKDLVAFFGKDNSPKLHLQLIHYARAFCPALHHKLERCVICSQLRS